MKVFQGLHSSWWLGVKDKHMVGWPDHLSNDIDQPLMFMQVHRHTRGVLHGFVRARESP